MVAELWGPGSGTNMYLLLIIGAGGFVGAISRYIVGGWIQNNLISFPMGTLGVNFIGSFGLSFIMYLSEYKGFFTEETRVFLTIGLLGAFTTMSSFGYESFKLFEGEEILLFGLNVIGTMILVFAGIYLGKLVALNLMGG